MRGTTRQADRLGAIAAAGVEPFHGDPDRVATLAPALEHVTVGCVLLGSASGTPDQLAALHGSRLDMLLTRMLDTTVRGVLYEASGSVQPSILRGGAERVERACADSRIPYELLLESEADRENAWVVSALHAVERLLAVPGSAGPRPRPR